jgi:MFS transporter, DHA1 family, multidrug resistance protein
LPVHVVTAIAPIALYAMGMALAMTPISLLAMDLFPLRKGMASALQGFAQTTSNAMIAAFMVSLLLGSLFSLSLGMLMVVGLSWLFWFAYLFVPKNTTH